MEKDDQKALAMIDLARRKGINYFDSGSDYGGGQSELRIGEATQPYRKDIYLSTKFAPNLGPDKLMQNFERSLKRLRTDYVDNVNMHGLTRMQDTEDMFATGTLEAVVKLKEQGLVKHIGASAHKPAPLYDAMQRFQFDSVMAATNGTRYHFVGEFDKIEGSFEDTVIPLANKQGIGLWAFKVTGQRLLIAMQEGEPGKATGMELIRYGFSLPVHGVILGMTTEEHVTTACDLAANLVPMTEAEMKAMNEKLAPSADRLTYLDPNYVDDGGWRAHLA
jgi:aryl-alcohol dehydrogenase-like predicted oxidoreductase